MDPNELIQDLKKSIAEGRHWYLAMLETIGRWTVPEEEYNGRKYCYLISGEAFDWSLLAERICHELKGHIPEEERIAMLFGKTPLSVSLQEFKDYIGKKKYSAFLNYFYGIVVEQALQLAVELEIDKENHSRPHSSHSDGKLFRRIYGAGQEELWNRFLKEKRRPYHEDLSLREMDEFTYWLFKYRFANSDSARVASDTQKALRLMSVVQMLPAVTDQP